MIFTNNSIYFPATQTGFFTHYHRPIINADTVTDLPPIVLVSLLLDFLAAVSKMLVQRAALKLVGPDMLADPLIINQQVLFDFQPA